jgi:hypothetical protein
LVAWAIRQESVSPPGAGYTKFVKSLAGTASHAVRHAAVVSYVPAHVVIIRLQ